MKWVLVALCSIMGASCMPQLPHILDDQQLDNEYFTGFVPLIRYYPELLYNSEVSPALPALPTGKVDASRFKSSSNIDEDDAADDDDSDSTTVPTTTRRVGTYIPGTTPQPTTTSTSTYPTTTTTTTIPTTTTTTSTTTTPTPKFRDDRDNGGIGATTAASSSQTTFLLPIRGASPSIQFLPPSVLPATPTTISPRNIHDIPLSLVSLSGNSGAITSSEEEDLKSPNPEQMGVDFTKFRYHVETGKLVKIGSTGEGICPKNMRFFAVPGHPKNGACDCDYYQCSRPLIYSPEKHQCFWAWSRGPCGEGEWFIFNKDLRKRGVCEKSSCPPDLKTDSNNTLVSDSSSDYFFLNPDDDTCYEAGTQGYCKDSDERLLIYPGEPIPKCRKFTLCYPLTVPQELQCVYGNKYFVEGGRC